MVDARVLKVIDLAYQAATDSTLWAPTLEAAADAMGGSAASLTWQSGSESGGVSTRGDPDAVRQYFDHYEAINPIQIGFDRMRMSDREARPVMTDRACVDRDEFVTGEYFNDFWRPHDLGSAVLITGAGFRIDGTAPGFNVFRPFGAEEFGAAELEISALLHQPLQRAYQMSRRLARERRLGESVGEFVAQLSGAVFAVAGDGSIAYANPAGEAMLVERDGLFSDRRRLRAHSAGTQRLLAALLAAGMADEVGRRRGGSLALPRPSGRRALALLATPTRSEPDPLAGRPLVLLSVVDPELGQVIPEERLRAYFGFSPAEARIAAEMLAGYDAREIADRLGRSIHTVRLQIARVRESTASRRQGEAVAVMLRALGVGGLRG
ncbi:MAG TPA: helix-turn-helix transcriptional regulator [Caulobacteraceae bacterium]|nr:helix-turn-helix transcriptional regulator [Caulobacteraceae bacterium]